MTAPKVNPDPQLKKMFPEMRGWKVLLILLAFFFVGLVFVYIGVNHLKDASRDFALAVGTTFSSTAIVAFCFDFFTRRESQRIILDTVASALSEPGDLIGALSPEARDKLVQSMLSSDHLTSSSDEFRETLAIRSLGLHLGENSAIAEPLLELIKSHFSGARRYDSPYKSNTRITTDPNGAACRITTEIRYKEKAEFLQEPGAEILRLRVATAKHERDYASVAAGNEWALAYLERPGTKFEIDGCSIGGIAAAKSERAEGALQVHEFTIQSNDLDAAPEDALEIVLKFSQIYENRVPVLVHDLTETFLGCEFSVCNEHPDIKETRIIPRMTSTDFAPPVRILGDATKIVSSEAWVFPTTSVVVALHWN